MTLPPVGVALVGHGKTASGLLEAARAILGSEALPDVVAIDAGAGKTALLDPLMCEAIERADGGRGVVVLVDLLGASPCQCAQQQGLGHEVVVLSGLNLAMVLKIATVDRGSLTATDVAEACADSARRSVEVRSLPICQEIP
jgi:mannose/fructose-specific phosphotransferase system component IIA